MSEVVALTGGATATIYGTMLDAANYIGGSFGDTYTAWLALTPDQKKQTLIAAARFLDRQAWIEDYADFAARDAELAFQLASYELAVMIGDDPEVVASYDAGSNLQSAYAGGAGVQFFAQTTAAAGTAPQLPPILQRLLGEYLEVSTGKSTIVASSGQRGSCVDPFSDAFNGNKGCW